MNSGYECGIYVSKKKPVILALSLFRRLFTYFRNNIHENLCQYVISMTKKRINEININKKYGSTNCRQQELDIIRKFLANRPKTLLHAELNMQKIFSRLIYEFRKYIALVKHQRGPELWQIPSELLHFLEAVWSKSFSGFSIHNKKGQAWWIYYSKRPLGLEILTPKKNMFKYE